MHITTQGFDFSSQVTTDANGNFTTTFTPMPNLPGGTYNVFALNPALTDTTPQATFTLQSLQVIPTRINLQVAANYSQALPITLSNGQSGPLTNLAISLLAADQPGGALPTGFTFAASPTISTLGSGASITLSPTLSADNTASNLGTLYLRVSSAENPSWQLIEVDYTVVPATPILSTDQSFLSLGTNPGNTVSQTVTLTNSGAIPLMNATFALQTTTGAMAPSWATLQSVASLASLATNSSVPIVVSFTPPDVNEYDFNLVITAQNHPAYTVPIHVSSNTSTTGSAQFQVVDGLSTGSVSTGFTSGVQGASVLLQNQSLTSSVFSLTADQFGLVNFSNIPTGTYNYQVTAAGHATYTGTVTIQANTDPSQLVVLQYQPVTITWSVVPTTIQDQYNLVVNTTFATNVPVPVLVIDPGAVNLPVMNAGDVYNVQANVSNYGLINADNFVFNLPSDTANFHFELVGTVPTTVPANSTIPVLYRVHCIQALSSVATTDIPTNPFSISNLIGQTTSTSQFISAITATANAKCANGTTFYSAASQIISATVTIVSQQVQEAVGTAITAAYSQAQSEVQSQSQGAAPSAVLAVIQFPPGPPTPKCPPPPVNSVNIYTEGLSDMDKQSNPGGLTAIDYNTDINRDIFDKDEPVDKITGFSGVTKNGLTQVQITTDQKSGTVSLSIDTPTLISVWELDSSNNLIASNLSWDMSKATSPIDIYVQGLKQGTTGLQVKSTNAGVSSDFLKMTVIDLELGVDGNRDQSINCSGDYKSPLPAGNDLTSQLHPYRFWINDNEDVPRTWSIGQTYFHFSQSTDQWLLDPTSTVTEPITVPPATHDYDADTMASPADLQDWTRLRLRYQGPSNTRYKICLELTTSSGNSQMKLMRAVQYDSLAYLQGDPQNIGQPNPLAVKQSKQPFLTVDNPSTFFSLFFPPDPSLLNINNSVALLTPSAEVDSNNKPIDFSNGQNIDYLFEGAGIGLAHCVPYVYDTVSQKAISVGTPVWIDLRNIKTMYQRYDSDTTDPAAAKAWVALPDTDFSQDPDETPTAILLIHGWDTSRDYATSNAEAMFKRLWWQGYHGRLEAFHWNTIWSYGFEFEGAIPGLATIDSFMAKYDDSEYNGWGAGSSVVDAATKLPQSYRKFIIAHSMGNVVAGASLLAGLDKVPNVTDYIMLNAAMPAEFYDGREAIRPNNESTLPTAINIGLSNDFINNSVVNTVIPNTIAQSARLLPFTSSASLDLDLNPTIASGGYRNALANYYVNNGQNIVIHNYFLQNDAATSQAWVLNNELTKPQFSDFGLVQQLNLGKLVQYSATGLSRYPGVYEITINKDGSLNYVKSVTDTAETRAYGCKSLTRAAGAGPLTRGYVDDWFDMDGPTLKFNAEHSAEFNESIQYTWNFYEQISKQLGN